MKIIREDKVTQRVATKTRIQQLRSNVRSQESKLEKGMHQLERTRQKKSKTTGAGDYYASEWDALEKIIRTMDDLLVSYRRYVSELEIQNTKLSTQNAAKVSGARKLIVKKAKKKKERKTEPATKNKH